MHKQEAEQHLAECEACRKAVEETEKIRNLCNNLPEVPLPEGFSARLHERLMQEQKPKKIPMFHLQTYKRGFAVGAAVLAASMVFVATPFFRLYNESGNVPSVDIEKNVTTTQTEQSNPTEQEPQAEPMGRTAEKTTQQPIAAATQQTPAVSDATEPTRGTVETVEKAAATTAAVPETPTTQPQQSAPTPAGQQPEQPVASAQPTQTQTEDVVQPTTQPQTTQPTIGATDVVPYVTGRGGGGSGAAVAMNMEAVQIVLADTAQNRAWVQENAAAYDQRQSVDGVDVVTLSEEEYEHLVYNGPEADLDWEIPQAVQEVMQPEGHYVILK